MDDLELSLDLHLPRSLRFSFYQSLGNGFGDGFVGGLGRSYVGGWGGGFEYGVFCTLGCTFIRCCLFGSLLLGRILSRNSFFSRSFFRTLCSCTSSRSGNRQKDTYISSV